jgi:hypothetical protein
MRAQTATADDELFSSEKKIRGKQFCVIIFPLNVLRHIFQSLEKETQN